MQDGRIELISIFVFEQIKNNFQDRVNVFDLKFKFIIYLVERN